MVVKIEIFLCVLLIMINNLCYSELSDDLQFIIEANKNEDKFFSYGSYDTGNILWYLKYSQHRKSKIKTPDIKTLSIVAKQMLIFYQKYISTQDRDVCMFIPTCSEFSKQAFSKYGLIWGFLMTSDRLQRCNGIGRNYYTIDNETGLAVDPIERNFIFRK